ncbi:MAG TPA: FAD-dependent oxidoreductase [Acidimicrobiales bacterium]|nr:FAD-dependent oxidoreductase [Acidimicrobiales bacterium]
MTITGDRPDTALPQVTVLVDRCAGCQECLVRCPTGAISLNAASWVVTADELLCNGCRQCVRTCPFAAITVSGPIMVAPRTPLVTHHPDALLSDHSETRRGITSWDDAMREAERCLACPDPTCVRGCPAHNDIPSFIASLGRGDLDEAHAVLRRTSTLPDVCARVCDQAVQCEGACSWSLAGGEPVAIGALERFVTDNAPVPPPRQKVGAGPGMDVAIVGSGPAGLAAAWDLHEAGANVTVFEQDAEAGGLLRWGIPDFTLPPTIANRAASALADSGVTFRFGTRIGADEMEQLLDVHDAVLMAVGAGMPLALDVPGTDLGGVWDATRFLTEAHEALARGDGLSLGDAQSGALSSDATVLVLGAGNTAMDVARTARRLGARAVCIDWMDRRFAPVRPDELDEAEEEGVEIRFLTTLERITGSGGRVAAAHLAHTTQKSASAKPVVTKAAPDTLEVDLVVMAMGYRIEPSILGCIPGAPVAKTVAPLPDRQWVASGLLANAAPSFARHHPVGRLALGRETARVAAGVPCSARVWRAGDALTGPSTVVEAMAQGREAARGILRQRPRRPFAPPRGASHSSGAVAFEGHASK